MHCWARYLFILSVVALGISSMVGACGRKGPLYLPDDKAAAQTQGGGEATASDVPAPPAADTSPAPDRP